LRILGIIPARGGSKGVPGKNTKLLNNIPLINYTLEAAIQSKLLTKIIVSSEDENILKYASKYSKIEIPFIRPSELSDDKAPTFGVIKHALNFFDSKGELFDAVCILQTTTPFRNYNDIDRSIKIFIEKEADTLISVRKVPDEYNPHWCFEEKNGFLEISTGDKYIIPNRQSLPDTYFRDGSIYIISRQNLISRHTLLGKKITYLISSSPLHVNIDTLNDWTLAESIIKEIENEKR